MITKTTRHPKAKRWPKRYYIAVTKRGVPVVRDGQVPIYWMKKVAKADFAMWKDVTIKRCSILIEP